MSPLIAMTRSRKHEISATVVKASLFMAAGIIDHETGTRDIRRLSGLYAFMPITATLAMVAAGSMAGVPLLNGFLSKEMFLRRDNRISTCPAVFHRDHQCTSVPQAICGPRTSRTVNRRRSPVRVSQVIELPALRTEDPSQTKGIALPLLRNKVRASLCQ